MLKFVLPEQHNRDDVISFYDKIAHSGDACIGFQNYKDYDGWLAGMQNRYTGKNLPEGYVRENFYPVTAKMPLLQVYV